MLKAQMDMDEFLNYCYLGRGRAKELSFCFHPIFSSYHDFCDYPQSVNHFFLAVHCRINFFKRRYSNGAIQAGGMHSTFNRMRHESMAWHQRKGKSYASFWIRLFGDFFIAGIPDLFYFIAPFLSQPSISWRVCWDCNRSFYWQLGTGVSSSLAR